MFAKMFAKVFAILAMFALARATDDHPTPGSNPHSLVDSTVKPEHGATTLNSRSHSSYYCEWDWWSNKFWVGLTQVKSGKAKTFDKCAMECCKNPYCATFDWDKRRKRCYQYNQNIGTDNLMFDDAPGWKMGALTYKNGYSYV